MFLILSWALLGVVYWIVNDTQTKALVGTIDADISTIKNGYRGEGLPEAIEVVHQRLGAGKYSGEDLPGGYILIRDEATGKFEGNLQLEQFKLGLFSVRAPRNQKRHSMVNRAHGSVSSRSMKVRWERSGYDPHGVSAPAGFADV